MTGLQGQICVLAHMLGEVAVQRAKGLAIGTGQRWRRTLTHDERSSVHNLATETIESAQNIVPISHR